MNIAIRPSGNLTRRETIWEEKPGGHHYEACAGRRRQLRGTETGGRRLAVAMEGVDRLSLRRSRLRPVR